MSDAARSNKRLLSIDVLRGLAVLLMIETHVVGVTLASSFRTTLNFELLEFMNGLVAPTFLFVAGFSTVLASNRYRNDYRAIARKYGPRILGIWVLGYALRLPGFSVGKLIAADSSAWNNFAAVDILHCIAIGWLLLLAVRVVCRSDAAFRRACLGLSAIFVLAAAPLWQATFWESLPAALSGYFTSSAGSLFPIFPWAGYMTAGAALCTLQVEATRKGSSISHIKMSIFASAALVIVCFATLWLVLDRMSMPWDANPLGSLMRLSLVVLLACFAQLWYEHVSANTGKWTSAMVKAGRHSLSIYAIHLLLLYRVPFGKGTASEVWGGTLNYFESGALTLALVLLMLAWTYLLPIAKIIIEQISRAFRRSWRQSAEISTAALAILVTFFSKWHFW